jgi:diphosphomevalonate decarboxylase
MFAVARSNANIALVKYWGKRDATLNLPVTGSLSVTLKELETETAVHFDPKLQADSLELNGKPADRAATAKVSKFLDLVRSGARIHDRARVISTNSFPTASGLASSSSAFSALAVAATNAAGLLLPPPQLSELARRGSGSAARSIFGGFVEMLPGILSDGSDAVAVPVAPEDHWDIRIVVGVATLSAKATSSTDGMETTTRTSPYYPVWVQTQDKDLAGMRKAVLERDLTKVGEIMEHNALKMHACALAARPGVLYWSGRTIDMMHSVYALRREGVPAYFTMDAGPHVKVLCMAPDAERVARALSNVHGVAKTIICSPGAGTHLVEPQHSAFANRF